LRTSVEKRLGRGSFEVQFQMVVEKNPLHANLVLWAVFICDCKAGSGWS